MKNLIRLLIFTISMLVFGLSQPVLRIYAADNFITDYDVTYTVKEDGITHANIKVTLTNSSNDYYYASSYKVNLGFENLTNITARDTGGVITPQITKNNTGYTMQLVFNNKVVGIGNKQILNLDFDTPDIAQKEGSVWEINIPGIDEQKSINKFDVDLVVPDSFGKPAYIKPAQKNDSLHFTKEQLTKSGISIAYGQRQQYTYTLYYHLQNRNLFPIRTEIALPPDTNYQEVYITSISPEPVQVKRDEDNNWLAEYELGPAQTKEVKVNGLVNINLYPKKVQITQDDEMKYLQDKAYWPVSDKSIQSLAKNLKTPQAIYDYTVKTLQYDFGRITDSNNRLGAVNVLQKPKSAVCLEFTDLFITLSRAAGIPAREVDGYAYTKNTKQRPLSLLSDVLHAWPEYYDKDKQTWVMVDPTWGNTTGGVDYFNTLDFDHFVFVKKGMSSTYPIPAGGYKTTDNSNGKDIYITSSDNPAVQKAAISMKVDLNKIFTSGIEPFGAVKITNYGPRVSKGERLVINASNLIPAEQQIKIGELLPYENKTIKFSFAKDPFLTNKNSTVKITAAGNNHTQNIKIVPVFMQDLRMLGGVSVVVFAVIIFIFAVKTRRISISK